MRFTIFHNLKNPAILVPGFLSGFVIWALFFLSHTGMIPAGTQAYRAVFIELVLGPLLLVIAGAASEMIRDRDGRYDWTPLIPSCAGFLGAGTAMVMLFTETAMTQYLPLLAPGIAPRLAYVIGHIRMYIPIIIVLSAFGSLFSLIAGICTHWILTRADTTKTDR